MSDDKYCTNCGAKLEPGIQYCSSCGASVNATKHGFSQPYSHGPGVGFDYAKQDMKSRLTTYSVLTVIYGILAVVLGWYVYCFGSTLNIYSVFTTLPYSAAHWCFMGMLSVASGIVAFVGAFLAHKAQMFNVTVLLYIVASVLSWGFASIISLAIGLVMTYLVFKCESAFDN